MPSILQKPMSFHSWCWACGPVFTFLWIWGHFPCILRLLSVAQALHPRHSAWFVFSALFLSSNESSHTNVQRSSCSLHWTLKLSQLSLVKCLFISSYSLFQHDYSFFPLLNIMEWTALQNWAWAWDMPWDFQEYRALEHQTSVRSWGRGMLKHRLLKLKEQIRKQTKTPTQTAVLTPEFLI